MSLLLNSLKKADQENQTAAADGQEVVAATSPQGVEIAESPAASSVASVDFDTIESAVDDKADVESTLSHEGVTEQKDLVSASRVFRANDDQQSSGGKNLYVIIVMLVIIGGSFGVLTSGIIPGISTSSLLGIFDEKKAVVEIDQDDDIPILAAGTNKLVALPVPLVDIQADVEFAGLQVPTQNDLSTQEGRREYAKKIAILTGRSASDEENEFFEAENDELLGFSDDEEFNVEAEIEDEGSSEQSIEEVYSGLKTAKENREQRFAIGRRTPSDGVISRGLSINRSDNSSKAVVLAQASTEEVDVSVAVESDIATEEEATDIVTPSLSGIDRQRMLGEARRFYIDGSYANAESVYRNILAKNSTNLDALRGLALVAVATGRYQAAAATYLKILEYYPNDPIAVADLTNLHEGVSGEKFYEIESALKKIIGKKPELDARIYFALGNLYAKNSQWQQAQQSYFKAHSEEQTNPDYAYNLAVVLDYLNKPELAVNYYREALNLAKDMPSGFNSSEVDARINSILK